MAYSSNPCLYAGGSILPSTFIKLSTAADFTALQSTSASDAIVGISQEGTNLAPGINTSQFVAFSTGESVRMYAIGNVCLLRAGTTFNAGTYLSPDSQGRGFPSVSGNRVGAVSLERAVATDNLVRVQVLIFDY